MRILQERAGPSDGRAFVFKTLTHETTHDGVVMLAEMFLGT